MKKFTIIFLLSSFALAAFTGCATDRVAERYPSSTQKSQVVDKLDPVPCGDGEEKNSNGECVTVHAHEGSFHHTAR